MRLNGAAPSCVGVEAIIVAIGDARSAERVGVGVASLSRVISREMVSSTMSLSPETPSRFGNR
eukprot:IDg7553t1